MVVFLGLVCLVMVGVFGWPVLLCRGDASNDAETLSGRLGADCYAERLVGSLRRECLST